MNKKRMNVNYESDSDKKDKLIWLDDNNRTMGIILKRGYNEILKST